MKVQSSASARTHREQQQLHQQASCSQTSTSDLICSDSYTLKACQHGITSGTTTAFAAGRDSIDNIGEGSNSSRDLEQLMKHAEDISAELSALLPEAGLSGGVLPTKAVKTAGSGPAAAACVISSTSAPTVAAAAAAESHPAAAARVISSSGAPAAAAAAASDPAVAAHVNSSTGAAAAAADVSGMAGAEARKGLCCDQPPHPLQLPLHVSSSNSTRRTAQQQRGVIDSARNRLAVVSNTTTSYQNPLKGTCAGVAAQTGTSASAAAHHELLVKNQSDLANSSCSSSSGGSSSSALTPGVPGSNSFGSSGLGSGTNWSGFLATVSAACCKAQLDHHQQQQQQQRKVSVTAPGKLNLPLWNPAAGTQIAVEPKTAGDSHAALSMQVASRRTQQLPDPHAAVLAAKTLSLPYLHVGTQAQTALRHQQDQQQHPSLIWHQGNVVIMGKPGAQPTAAAAAARATGVANIHRRALLSNAAAASVAGSSSLGGSLVGDSPTGSSPLGAFPLGGSPLGPRKRRSSESTQFDVAWPAQHLQQQQQERGCYEASADCSGASKPESAVEIPALKKAKIDAKGLLTRMSAVVASVYGAAAAQRAITAAHAELWRLGYIEAR